MTPDEYAKVQEISRLLHEAYDHYFKYEGHCKSAEGHIQVSYGNFWEREDPSALTVKGISIYSYVFCRNGRSKDWDTIDEALEEVRGWHAEEMSYDYESEEAVENRRLEDEMAAAFLKEMMDSGRLTIIDVPAIDDDEEEENYGFPV